ncbi:MAG: dihydroxyacetone kinase subunit DhaK [Desulfovibrionales bacterium]|nr:dihydroxyacetone kinase subunit DhaK [Desulfovibrionales bacterium]
MKKFINDVDGIVREQLEGVAALAPWLHVSFSPKYVCRKNIPKGKVAVITGAGSGHEPLDLGLVGCGFLDGACVGEIFTSPTPDQMIACANAVDQGHGVLFIVKNYTGDVLNAQTAMEVCAADNMTVQCLIIDDDVAVPGGKGTAGRRGTGLSFFVEKIVGAAAEAGYSLEECVAVGRKAVNRGRSMGLALTSCTVPSFGRPANPLEQDEVELGIGLHCEPGIRKVPMGNADYLVGLLLEYIFADPLYVRTLPEWDAISGTWKDTTEYSEPIEKGDELMVFINGMGASPPGELYGVARSAIVQCKDRGMSVVRSMVGTFLSSLDMQGCSISLLRADEELLRLWDAEASTLAFAKSHCDMKDCGK